MSEIDLLIQELRDTIDNQKEEIDRLSNIIKELEKYLKENENIFITTTGTYYYKILGILNKGSDKQ